MKYNTDKYSHGFIDHYIQRFTPIKNSVKNVLEIGIKTGESIKLWKDFFPNATIYGMDIRLHPVSEDRVVYFKGDQSSTKDLLLFIDKYKVNFDIVIDDGGHTMQQQQISLKTLYRKVVPGGFYVIEDLHTSDPNFIQRVSGKHIWGADTVDVTTLEVVNNIRNNINKSTYFISLEDMKNIINLTECVEVISGHKNIQKEYHYTSKIAFLKIKC